MNKIALNFEDGYTRIIEGWDGETVANTAYRLGINVPLDCGDGACGTCKCKVKSGLYDLGDEYIEDALSEEEAADGFALACQMKPQSDVVVEILASSAACKVKTESFATIIQKIEFLSSEIVKLTVETVDKRKVNFLAGQYANIEIPNSGGKTRSFSFSGVSGDGSLEFIIRLLPDGLASNYFKTNAVGETLNMTAPFGSFYSREIKAPTLFFAGGTGIAPFLAMLENLDNNGGLKHSIQLFYGATTDENLVELERLDSFKSKLQFQYQTCVSLEDSRKHTQGFVTQWITKENLGLTRYDMYICGPPAMVDAVKNSIQTEGIVQNNFYEEKFNPSGV